MRAAYFREHKPFQDKGIIDDFKILSTDIYPKNVFVWRKFMLFCTMNSKFTASMIEITIYEK